MNSTKKQSKAHSSNPNPQASAPATPQPPAPTPAVTAPDPNAALAQYVQQTLTAIDGIEVGLGADPALTPVQKRHAAKLRKGGEKILGQLGNLAKQQQIESPSLNVDSMNAALGKAQALQPLADRLATFAKHVQDVIFSAESEAMVDGLQFYAVLQRRATTDSELNAALQPVGAFFAYRRPAKKEPGTPGKPTQRATKKAVATLKKNAPELLQPAQSGQGAVAAPAAVAPAAPAAGAVAQVAAPAAPAGGANGGHA